MRHVTVELESIAPYSQSRKLDEFPKGKSESWNDYEKRVWKDKANYDENGVVYIPPMALKQAIDSASKYLGKIQGKGNATWTKHFVGGVLVFEGIALGVKREDLTPVTIQANSDGVRGSGSRVPRTFPVVSKWSGQFKAVIASPEITKDVFAQALEIAGTMVGVGRFRAEKGGLNGRFIVKSIKWSE